MNTPTILCVLLVVSGATLDAPGSAEPAPGQRYRHRHSMAGHSGCSRSLRIGPWLSPWSSMIRLP